MSNLINWADVISNLKNGVEITADKSKWNLETPGYLEIYKMWEDAEFNLSSVKWINYYPGIHYSNDIDKQISNQLGITTLRSWISQINPGYCAPWHWDVDDNEQEYLNKGTIERYSCFICPPSPGHMFQLGGNYYTNEEQGTIVKWPNYKEWHAGTNVGLKPKFMYHIIGYKN